MRVLRDTSSKRCFTVIIGEIASGGLLKAVWLFLIFVSGMLAGCSPGSGEIQWTSLHTAPAPAVTETPDSPVVPPEAKGLGLTFVQVGSGSGVVRAGGLSARISLGVREVNGSQNGLGMRNFAAGWEN